MLIDIEKIHFLTSNINQKIDLINSLDSTLFFDGTEKGGEDEVEGIEGRAIKFWSRNKNDFAASNQVTGIEKENFFSAFGQIIDTVSSIPNIDHCYLFFINPGVEFPIHKDEEDPCMRFVIGVNEPGIDYGLKVEGYPDFKLLKNQYFDLDAQNLEHGGWNFTDNIWLMLVLCYNKNEF